MTHELPKAMLIDMDDTILVAGERPVILRQVADEFIADLAGHSPAALTDQLEAALTLFWSDPARHKIARFGLEAARRQVVREVFVETGQAALTETVADRFAARFTALREEVTACFPGAREGLEGLRAHGVRLALITNGSSATQRAKIERFALAPLFDHIQIEGEVGFGKPEARAYHHAMDALDAQPHETWIVGDHLEWEVAAPQRLGLHAVWCDGFGKGLPVDAGVTPNRIIRSLLELVPPMGASGRAG